MPPYSVCLCRSHCSFCFVILFKAGVRILRLSNPVQITKLASQVNVRTPHLVKTTRERGVFYRADS